MSSARSSGPRSPTRRTHREVLIVGSVALIVLIVVGAGAALASGMVARHQALDESERRAGRFADFVVKPLLPAYLTGDPDSVRMMDAALALRASADDLLQVTVWRADGTVLLTSNPDEVGEQVTVSKDMRQALAGVSNSYFEVEGEVEPGDDPHVSGAAPGQAYAEIYTPLDGVAGEDRLVLEAYYDYDRIDEIADGLLWTLLPLVLVPLVVLQAVQLPITLSLSRRLRRHEAERNELLEEALAVSDRERARVAGDLHDGPIQDLAGISLAIGAVAGSVPAQHQPMMVRIEDGLLRSVQSLRGLMSDLYPPDLQGDSLANALESLAGPLRESEVDVDVTATGGDLGLDDESVLVLYRFSREALANIAKHAEATAVQIHLEAVAGTVGAAGVVRLTIADNGVGSDLTTRTRPADGHLGMRLLVDRIESLSGRVVVTTAPDHGMTVQAEVPRQA